MKEKRTKIKFQPKWFSGDVNEEIKLRDYLLKKAVRSQLAEDTRSLFKKIKDKVTRWIRQATKATSKGNGNKMAPNFFTVLYERA